MKNNYVYPAKISNNGDELILEFLDFSDLVVIEDNEEKLIESAQEILALSIMDLLAQGKEVPKPSREKRDIVYIHVWLPYYRTMEKEVYVKKTVTIPQWLDLLAKENKVNFSACLVKGIKDELGIG